MKRHILIIFPDEWLSHSPTVLNLVKIFRNEFKTTVLTFTDGTFRNEQLDDEEFSFIRIPHGLARVFLRRARILYSLLKAGLLLLRLRTYRKSHPVDEVIAIDSVGLWAAQTVFGRCHFLSLEVKRDVFFRMCTPARIRSVVIQTPERLSALMPGLTADTFYIQNAPSLTGNDIDRHQKSSFNGTLLFFGNILPSHGIYAVLEALDSVSGLSYTLTIKGIIYKDRVRTFILERYKALFKRGKIILDETYTPQDEIIDYISQFSLGFCLYDFNRISSKDFNYLSSPSGKLFNYYAAGVPVIGTDVLGLKSVRQFRTGVLIQEISPGSIQEGISKIIAGYREFSRNCILAAKYFDFDKTSAIYKQYLRSLAND